MNTHDIDIELPPLPPGYKSYEFPDGGYDADEMQAYARAAIEADRLKRENYINDDRDYANILRTLAECRDIAMEWTMRGRIPECGKFGEIAQDLDAVCAELEREGKESPDTHRGECVNVAPQPAEPVKNTCKKCNGTGVESTRFHGVWPNGEECLEPIKCDQCDGFGTTSAAEPVNKTDWNNELSSWSDEDFIRIFHERPDLANRLRKILAEPVKVDTKASVPSDAISVVGMPEYDALMDFIYENGTASEGVTSLANAFARAAIEAYSSPISNNDDCRSLSAKTDRQPIYQIRIAGERGYAWLDVDEQQYEIFGQYPILFERRVVYEQN